MLLWVICSAKIGGCDYTETVAKTNKILSPCFVVLHHLAIFEFLALIRCVAITRHHIYTITRRWRWTGQGKGETETYEVNERKSKNKRLNKIQFLDRPINIPQIKNDIHIRKEAKHEEERDRMKEFVYLPTHTQISSQAGSQSVSHFSQFSPAPSIHPHPSLCTYKSKEFDT